MATKRARRGRGVRLTTDEREELVERFRAGQTAVEVAAAIGCTRETVFNIYGRAQLLRRRSRHSRLRLSFSEREQISRGLAAGKSFRAIARELGRAPSTISPE